MPRSLKINENQAFQAWIFMDFPGIFIDFHVILVIILGIFIDPGRTLS